MNKTILLTGATDGIGLATAKKLVAKGHHVLLHGRNRQKLQALSAELSELPDGGTVESYVADLSSFEDVESLAADVKAKHEHIDVLINNAGVYKTSQTMTPDGLDVRFMVNAIAPYLLTQRLLPLLGRESRVINLSSAAQAPVDLRALAGARPLEDMAAYAQSKLAITMWSRHLATTLGDSGPVFIAVNPGSLLATKMVREGFGVPGSDVAIGATILEKLALDDTFRTANGKYFDNDAGHLAAPHRDALQAEKCQEIVSAIEALLSKKV